MKNEKGLTLIELIVAAALISVVLVGLLNVQYYMMKNTSVNQAREMLSYDSALIKRSITNDIRNASAPNKKTSPVNIVDEGQGLIVYTKKQNVYTQIFYRVSPTDSKILQRTSLTLAAGVPDPEITLPYYGVVPEDESLWSNITTLNQQTLFTAVASSYPEIVGIEFHITLKYDGESVNPIEIRDTVFSRNPNY